MKAAVDRVIEEKISVSGKRWVMARPDNVVTAELLRHFDIAEPVAQLMASRGIEAGTASTFLNPTLRELMPNPAHIQDMTKAAAKVAEAIEAKKKIALFGDYDVDGATSVAQMVRFLRLFGHEPLIHIPDRIAEGYGPNVPAIKALKEKGAEQILFLDCGTTAFEAVETASDLGLNPIIIDHHQAESALPKAYAVVNPNRLDESDKVRQACGHCAAAGITFLFLAALVKELGDPSYKKELMRLLDLVALGTVCDVMPLTGLNRAFVVQGLKMMADSGNPGLKALRAVTATYEKPTPYHLGFVVGPRLNAGGRVGDAFSAVTLLTTDDPAKARELAETLDTNNKRRKELEAQAEQAANLVADTNKPYIFVVNEDWHQGIIGIVASRLQNKYHKPVIVGTLNKGEIKASGRSVEGIDMGAILTAAKESDLLINAGGHEMAGGLTLDPSKQAAFDAFLARRMSALTASDEAPVLKLDMALQVPSVGAYLMDSLEKLEPFGQGNPTPRFVIENALINSVRILKEQHVMCMVAGTSGRQLKTMAFRSIGTPAGDALKDAEGKTVSLAGTLKKDLWQGRQQITFIIDDVML